MGTKKEKKVEMTDLELALQPFCPDGNVPPDLLEAVSSAMTPAIFKPDADLTNVDEKVLLEQDASVLARLSYVTSLIRISSYLRSGSEEPGAQAEKARVALGYIKHAEGSKHAKLIMNLGRSAGDKALVDEIDSLKGKLNELAQDRANVMFKQWEREAAKEKKTIDVEVEESEEDS